MSNLKPCANPRICGVQNHRPGTVCRAPAGRGPAGGSPAPDMGGALPSASKPSGNSVPDEVEEYQVDSLVSQSLPENKEWGSGNLYDKHPHVKAGAQQIIAASIRDGASPSDRSPEPEWEVNVHRVNVDGEERYLVTEQDTRAEEDDETMAEQMQLLDDRDSALEHAQHVADRWRKGWERDLG